MKNKNLSFTLTGRTKIFLFVCLGSAALVDFAAFVFLMATGVGSFYCVFPLLFLIADALFIVQAAFSNFRFKYTVSQIVFYLAFSSIVFLCMLGNYNSEEVFTTAAYAVWIALHLLSLVSALSCYIFTAKLSKNAAVHTVFSFAFAIVSAVLAIYYVISLIAVGFFGQGGYAIRPLIYEYDADTQTYTVTGVLEGNGKNVYIPEEFNGVKVSKVSYNVFSAPEVEFITLDCAADVEFTGEFSEAEYLSVVYVPKENIDIFKHELYADGLFFAANAMRPYDIESDDAYVTFSYDKQSYEAARGVIFDTWYGKKGDRLLLSYFDGVEYAKHIDTTSDSDLNWNFENNGRFILSSIDANGKNLMSVPVTENVDGAVVNFEKIYRVYPGESNDEKYPTAKDFTFSSVNGFIQSYKYTTAKNAVGIITNFRRSGFSLVWQKSETSYSEKKYFSDAAEALNSVSGNDAYFYPVWKLNSPTISAHTDKENNTVTYGDGITLSCEASAPTDGMTLSYEWYDETMRKSTQKNYVISKMPYGDMKYLVIVTVTGENTSLVSESVATLDVKVEKRPLTVIWTCPESNVYEGANKEIKCSIKEEILEGDNVLLSSTVFSYKTVGTYTSNVALTGFSSEKYRIVSGQSLTYAIEKADLTVNWLSTEATYSGEQQKPSISFSGLKGGDNIENYDLRGGINVGEYDVTLTVYDTFIKNYNLLNTNIKFTINPYPLNVIWRSDLQDTFVYDANEHAMSATAVGVGGKPVPLTYSVVRIKNAGEHTVTAYVSNTNYTIVSGETHTYTIKPYGLTVNWLSTTLTYNGLAQRPVYSLTGIGGDGNIPAGGTGAQKNVGEGYVFTLTETTNKNYYIAENSSTQFKIVPASVAVQWNVPYMMYNGKTQAPTAYIVGLGDDSAVSLSCSTTGAVNAGTHTSTATLTHELAKNYNLTNTTRVFTIEKYLVAVTVDDITIAYGDAVPTSFEYRISQVVEGDNANEVVTNVKFEIEGYSGGNLTPDEYKILATADVTSNYSFYSYAGKLIVTKRKVTIKIDDKTMKMGGNLPEFTYSVVSGSIIDGDDNLITFKLNKEVDGVGDYVISVDAYNPDYIRLYELGVQFGKLTVTEA